MAMASGQVGIHPGEKNLALGLDPGRNKTGFAFVNLDGELLITGIFSTAERDRFFDADDFSAWLTEGSQTKLNGRISFIFIGNGTGSKEFSAYVKSKVRGCQIVSVDESRTTLEARKLYWKIHKPGLLMRLLPESLRVPSRPLDDLAALALTLRGLQACVSESSSRV